MNEPVRRLPLPQQDRARGFAEALSSARGKHLLIALRGHPDPDGIASALAQAHIAQRLGVGKTTIGYCHELSHRENRALVKLLNVELKQDQEHHRRREGRLPRPRRRARRRPGSRGADGIEVLTIVDHHRAHVPPRARFVDMRSRRRRHGDDLRRVPRRALPALRRPVDDDRRVATALMHGLATDTDDFSLARSTDLRAASQLADVCDRDLLQDLSRRLIAPSAMDVIARSLASLFVRRNFAMAGVGFVAESERDTIAQAADFLIRREDIDTVVVYGIVGDRFIEGSLRTHSPSVDPAVWLEQAFGHDERGKAYGGGRRDKGGFRIPIGFLGRATDRAQLWALVEHAARQALLKQLGEENTAGIAAMALQTPPAASSVSS
jgi:nanoRNase/pAp phosphatase (c-di-AMP/oligoRNAs hydrolase)